VALTEVRRGDTIQHIPRVFSSPVLAYLLETLRRFERGRVVEEDWEGNSKGCWLVRSGPPDDPCIAFKLRLPGGLT